MIKQTRDDRMTMSEMMLQMVVVIQNLIVMMMLLNKVVKKSRGPVPTSVKRMRSFRNAPGHVRFQLLELCSDHCCSCFDPYLRVRLASPGLNTKRSIIPNSQKMS